MSLKCIPSSHFYIAKLGYSGVYLDCGYTLEPPCRGGSNEYPHSKFLSKNKKNMINIYLKFSFLQLKNHSCVLYGCVFVIQTIKKTCPCNVYPLEPHFYIAKLGYAGVYLFFLFLLQNIDCGYSLEPPRRGGSNVYPQSMF